MFGLFKKKDPIAQLENKKKELMEKAYKLSHTDRKASDMLQLEIQKIEDEITQLLSKR
jgi:hypothetical protein